VPAWAPTIYGAARRDRFRAMLEASRAEVYDVTAADWPMRLAELLAGKGVERLLYAPATATGRRLAEAWAEESSNQAEDQAGAIRPALVGYDRPVEGLKARLVEGVDAALTTARGGIADTGSLVLWPTPDEPRLMSLLPPLHVVLVRAASLTDSLASTITAQGWAGAMPTNALLISGPSKTADIEQTLAYGVHGPKELIVLVVGDE
jgi:L-lactate dehydrogenase complex protein LldG